MKSASAAMVAMNTSMNQRVSDKKQSMCSKATISRTTNASSLALTAKPTLKRTKHLISASPPSTACNSISKDSATQNIKYCNQQITAFALSHSFKNEPTLNTMANDKSVNASPS